MTSLEDKTKTDAEGGVESYVYDGNGNITEKIDGKEIKQPTHTIR